ncbi:four helix bundle protein [Pustulibacterium marinum]|uniref:Four helix bundle protein n=1 Tax=Pustulibacterium marinum TaxID=1224947 RepID=A0A1I7HVH2_9FLAO|nr:four helix bundle protein [Pustulibacterium marinum]SFU64670.1 four helix bundle protein [Pustulibacterium marinum]
MATFRDLLIWQKGMNLVTSIYKVTEAFPKEEQYNLTSQIRRSAISIPSNIAEGYGRDGRRDFLKYLNIALSSIFELQTQIEIAFNLNFIPKEIFIEIYEKTRELERMLVSFINKIKES